MGTTNILDLNNRVSELADGVTSVEDAVNELKSGLTNVDVALSVPEGSGKNLIPMTVDGLKKNNIVGTWTGNSYAINNGTIDVLIDTDGNVTGIKLNGTFNKTTLFYFDLISLNGSYIINGCPSGGSTTSYRLDLRAYDGGVMATDTGNGANTGNVSIQAGCVIRIENGTVCNNITFTPMIRPATITDPTFVPYIPSVESRIEAVEDALDKYPANNVMMTDGVTSVEDAVNELKSGLTNLTKNKGGTRVDIGSYVLPNVYECPSDGYVQIGCASGASGNVTVIGPDNSPLTSITCASDTTQPLYVRKGMCIYVEVLTGTPQFRFTPIV